MPLTSFMNDDLFMASCQLLYYIMSVNIQFLKGSRFVKIFVHKWASLMYEVVVISLLFEGKEIHNFMICSNAVDG